MGMTTLRLSDEQLKALRMISARESQSMNAIVRELVEAFLEDYFDNLAADKALAEQGEGEWTDLDELMDSVRPRSLAVKEPAIGEKVQKRAGVRRTKLKRVLERWVDLLKEKYDPEKVILFGSLGDDETGPWSDIDLVIVKDTKKRFLDRIKEVLVLLQPEVGVDILVYTPQEFQALASSRLFFKGEIQSRGKVVYERGR